MIPVYLCCPSTTNLKRIRNLLVTRHTRSILLMYDPAAGPWKSVFSCFQVLQDLYQYFFADRKPRRPQRAKQVRFLEALKFLMPSSSLQRALVYVIL